MAYYAFEHVAKKLGLDFYNIPPDLAGEDYFRKIVKAVREKHGEDVLIIEGHFNSHPGMDIFFKENGTQYVAKMKDGNIRKLPFQFPDVSSILGKGALIAEFGSAKQFFDLSEEKFEAQIKDLEAFISWYQQQHPELKDKKVVIIPGHGGINYKTSYFQGNEMVEKIDIKGNVVTKNGAPVMVRESIDSKGGGIDEKLAEILIAGFDLDDEEEASVFLALHDDTTVLFKADQSQTPLDGILGKRVTLHKVTIGDSLSKIAEKLFGSDQLWVKLKEIYNTQNPDNPIKGTVIHVGQEFTFEITNELVQLLTPKVRAKIASIQEAKPIQKTVKKIEPAVESQTTEKTLSYIVKKGDTLWDIAQKLINDPFQWQAILKIHNDNVKKLNRQDPSNKLKPIITKQVGDLIVAMIYPGQKIFLEGFAAAGVGVIKDDSRVVPRIDSKPSLDTLTMTDGEVKQEAKTQLLQEQGIFLDEQSNAVNAMSSLAVEKNVRDILGNAEEGDIIDPKNKLDKSDSVLLRAESGKAEDGKITAIKEDLAKAIKEYTELLNSYRKREQAYQNVLSDTQSADFFLDLKKAVIDVNAVGKIKVQLEKLKEVDLYFRQTQYDYIKKSIHRLSADNDGLAAAQQKLKEDKEALLNSLNVEDGVIEMLAEVEKDLDAAEKYITTLENNLNEWGKALNAYNNGEEININTLMGLLTEKDVQVA
ncbi:MAG: LysM peptidoglycan-binding domain-containing protein, partial [Candidatus Omnitrophica bacterium]|nr:LysM peptidoglycan-binding domain-containing protein [Candidatus Omnitrophota bacterium]